MTHLNEGPAGEPAQPRGGQPATTAGADGTGLVPAQAPPPLRAGAEAGSAPRGEGAAGPSGGPGGRVGGRALAAFTGWRLAVAACAFIGYVDVAVRFGDPLLALEDLSHLASFVAGVLYLGLAAYPFVTGRVCLEPRSPWARGSAAVALLLVGVVWHTLMDGLETGYLTTSALFTHLVTPLVVLVDWLFVGRNQHRARWWFPLSWTLPLLAYLVFMIAAGVESYSDFLDPASDGFAVTLSAFIAAVVVAGYGLLGTSRLTRPVRSAVADRLGA
ncbi:hypothetical protein [Streptomyces spiramenti]|uniref:Integral membrane protein n=1 Tax=Streptomyces spiramenti TaxID=2720606 RepID=A0ABX1AWW0_9ACTN|nr:hypothetical protein [Streptomyces spiramenti]NJP68867.1 hypothetical protein [Streptomyces spiramenti]